VVNIKKVIPSTEIIITIPPEEVKTHVAWFRLNQLERGEKSGELHTKLAIPSRYRKRRKKSLCVLLAQREGLHLLHCIPEAEEEGNAGRLRTISV
jgi:hypothetical protein